MAAEVVLDLWQKILFLDATGEMQLKTQSATAHLTTLF